MFSAWGPFLLPQPRIDLSSVKASSPQLIHLPISPPALQLSTLPRFVLNTYSSLTTVSRTLILMESTHCIKDQNLNCPCSTKFTTVRETKKKTTLPTNPVHSSPSTSSGKLIAPSLPTKAFPTSTPSATSKAFSHPVAPLRFSPHHEEHITNLANSPKRNKKTRLCCMN